MDDKKERSEHRDDRAKPSADKYPEGKERPSESGKMRKLEEGRETPPKRSKP